MSTEKDELSAINKEIDEANASIDSQRQQIRWLCQTYSIALAGLFTIAAYTLEHTRLSAISSDQSVKGNFSDMHKVILVICGMAFGLLVFFYGWISLSVIARKLTTIHLLNKHVAICRMGRAKFLDDFVNSKYVLTRDHSLMSLPGHINHLPYIFFAINFLVLLGSFLLFSCLVWDGTISVMLTISTAMFLGNIYPTACANFNKHVKIARKSGSFLEYNNWLNTIADFRKKAGLKRNLKRFAFWILVILAIGVFVTRDYNRLFINNENVFTVGFCIYGLLFGLAKWIMEITESRSWKVHLKGDF
jgi:hypothetical protein